MLASFAFRCANWTISPTSRTPAWRLSISNPSRIMQRLTHLYAALSQLLTVSNTEQITTAAANHHTDLARSRALASTEVVVRTFKLFKHNRAVRHCCVGPASLETNACCVRLIDPCLEDCHNITDFDNPCLLGIH